MNNQFYYKFSGTEDDHYYLESAVREYCDSKNFKFHYYRKLKTGHRSGIREWKISGNNVEKVFRDIIFKNKDKAQYKMLDYMIYTILQI